MAKLINFLDGANALVCIYQKTTSAPCIVFWADMAPNGPKGQKMQNYWYSYIGEPIRHFLQVEKGGKCASLTSEY